MLKGILLGSLIMGAAAPVLADNYDRRPPAGRACGCLELQRRVDGLNYAADHARRERDQLQRAVQVGTNILNQADRQPQDQQEATCSRGNEQINAIWVRWQPWIAQQGADEGNACE